MDINSKELHIMIRKAASICLCASKYEHSDLVQYGYECLLRDPKILNNSSDNYKGYIFRAITYFILNRIRAFRKDALFKSNAIDFSEAINKNADYNYKMMNKLRLYKKIAGEVPEWFYDGRIQDDIAKDYGISQQRISKVRKLKSKVAKEKYEQWEKLFSHI